MVARKSPVVRLEWDRAPDAVTNLVWTRRIVPVHYVDLEVKVPIFDDSG